MNASAVALFVFSPDVHWLQVAIVAVGGSIGGWLGALMLVRVNEKALRIGVTAIGVALTIGLFVKALQARKRGVRVALAALLE